MLRDVSSNRLLDNNHNTIDDEINRSLLRDDDMGRKEETVYMGGFDPFDISNDEEDEPEENDCSAFIDIFTPAT